MKKGAYHNTVVGSLIFAKEYVTLYKQIKVYVANSRGGIRDVLLCWTMKTPSFFYDNFYDNPNKVMTSYVRLCTLMKPIWINKVRKREVKSGYKILSFEIPTMKSLDK